MARETDPKRGGDTRVLRRIVDESERASRIIDDIRAMFRKDMKARETVDVNELISETLLLLEHEAKIQRVSVQASLSEAPAHTFAERIQLKQVLLNLMVNAIELMSSTVSGPRVLAVSSSADRNGVLITVQDSGPGIQSEDHEKIFEMFYTTKPQGMGIGLAMCRSIIEFTWRTASDVGQWPGRLHVPSLFAELGVDFFFVHVGGRTPK